MIERRDSIGRKIPPQIEIIPRHFVVAVGRVAEEILRQRQGHKPSREAIASLVKKAEIGTPEVQDLRTRANRKILGEFQDEVGGLINQGIEISTAQKIANNSIRQRYERLDKDPERNFAFLDDILNPVKVK